MELDCPQAWHAGLHSGMLVECRFKENHKGWHRNAKGDLSWGGHLTPEEIEIATRLRAEALDQEVKK